MFVTVIGGKLGGMEWGRGVINFLSPVWGFGKISCETGGGEGVVKFLRLK